MTKIHTSVSLVSACMAGVPCRYNGQAKTVKMIEQMVKSKQALAVCPEMLAGLPTPRRPAEIVGGNGDDVLDGKARIVDDQGQDWTETFVRGAYETLRLAQHAGVQQAFLKEGSPSCGCLCIYDGSFSGTQRAGYGVTAALLRRHNIAVVSEKDVLNCVDEEKRV